ncbi:unnamed protein product [Lymnaea stagnalis]|uniref:Uncharacterized protein n=1 Tax=Lymnaea stagnalis TaxID=6523 RepID=A0AAV2I147_LYMST
MDLSSFFSKLTKQTSFHQKCSHFEEREIFLAEPSFRNTIDQEGEGYVLVDYSSNNMGSGISYSDQSRENSNSDKQFDHPPSYSNDMVSEQLPSAKDEPPPASTSQIGHYHNTAVSDVPFQLHSSLLTQQQASTLFVGLDLKLKEFDWSRYTHDFSCELNH